MDTKDCATGDASATKPKQEKPSSSGGYFELTFPIESEPVSFAEALTPSTILEIIALLACLLVFFLVDNSIVTVLASVAVWTILYALLWYFFENCLRGGKDNIVDFPRGGYHISVFHQGVVLPLLFIIIMSVRAGHEKMDMSDWWKRGWGPGHRFELERQVQTSIMGYMLKDFKGGLFSLHWHFQLHHFLAVLVMTLVLLAPGGMGIVTCNGVNAEGGSLFYNFRMLFKHAWWNRLYAVMMVASNVLGAWMIFSYFFIDMGLEWTIPHLITGLALTLLRTVGLYLAFKKNDDADAALEDGKSNDHDGQPSSELPECAAPPEASESETSKTINPLVEVKLQMPDDASSVPAKNV